LNDDDGKDDALLDGIIDDSLLDGTIETSDGENDNTLDGGDDALLDGTIETSDGEEDNTLDGGDVKREGAFDAEKDGRKVGCFVVGPLVIDRVGLKEYEDGADEGAPDKESTGGNGRATKTLAPLPCANLIGLSGYTC